MKSFRPSIYYYNASSVTVHRAPTNRNAENIHTNFFLTQFDTTEDLEDGRLYGPMTGIDTVYLVSNKIELNL